MSESETRKSRWALWLIGGLVAGALAFALIAGGPDRPYATETLGLLADPDEVYPVTAGEPLPGGYRQLLRRDSILPVYDPEFTSADEVDWPNDSLIVGVAGAETAKAYPVTHLNSREMVVESCHGRVSSPDREVRTAHYSANPSHRRASRAKPDRDAGAVVVVLSGSSAHRTVQR